MYTFYCVKYTQTAQQLKTLIITEHVNGIHLLINLEIIYMCDKKNIKIIREIRKLKKIKPNIVVKYMCFDYHLLKIEIRNK